MFYSLHLLSIWNTNRLQCRLTCDVHHWSLTMVITCIVTMLMDMIVSLIIMVICDWWSQYRHHPGHQQKPSLPSSSRQRVRRVVALKVQISADCTNLIRQTPDPKLRYNYHSLMMFS